MSEKIRQLEGKVSAIEKKLDSLSFEFKNAFNYLQSDPAGSLNKTRIVMEKILIDIYFREMGKNPRKPLLGDILKDNQFTRKIERRILSRIHAIRDMANLGTHGENVIKDDAVDILDNLCKVVLWYFDKYLGISLKLLDDLSLEKKDNKVAQMNELSFEQKRIVELEDKIARIEYEKEQKRLKLEKDILLNRKEEQTIRVEEERKRLEREKIDKLKLERDRQIFVQNQNRKKIALEEKARKLAVNRKNREQSVNDFIVGIKDISIPDEVSKEMQTDTRFLLYSLENMNDYIKFFKSNDYPFFAALLLDSRKIEISEEVISNLENLANSNGFDTLNAALDNLVPK